MMTFGSFKLGAVLLVIAAVLYLTTLPFAGASAALMALVLALFAMAVGRGWIAAGWIAMLLLIVLLAITLAAIGTSGVPTPLLVARAVAEGFGALVLFAAVWRGRAVA